MVTVGLIKELHFISCVFKTSIFSKIHTPRLKHFLDLEVTGGILNVWYNGVHVWLENIEGESSFFGVESCDTISRIIACIDNGSPWEQYRWQDILDVNTSLK